MTEEVEKKKMKREIEVSETAYQALILQGKKENITVDKLGSNIIEMHLHAYPEGGGEVYDKRTGGRIFNR